ncbi:MAG: hypothetical protein KJ728_11785 [Alphaproteobacteria bacterium]|uniref:Uncharacterized protein n=1 Tax=viral metagenome TaxID=1070528 RepID=A0A6M3XBX4_9ZZZZ|nr:hypothetical protein [Alphaproteobacteria bacterium]
MTAAILYGVYLVGFVWFLLDHTDWMNGRFPTVNLTDRAVSLSMALCWPLVLAAALIDACFFEAPEDADQ